MGEVPGPAKRNAVRQRVRQAKAVASHTHSKTSRNPPPACNKGISTPSRGSLLTQHHAARRRLPIPHGHPARPRRRVAGGPLRRSGGTRFHQRPRFFMPRAWLLFCAERHVTGYPVRPLREWIRARVEPRPPTFLARRSARSVLDCGGAAERSHRFGRGARTGEVQQRSSPRPAGESGGKPHALHDLAESAWGGRSRVGVVVLRADFSLPPGSGFP